MDTPIYGWFGTTPVRIQVDATGHLQVDILSSALPAGAATSAAQATQLTALQTIDDLQDALESKALDRLLVRGMDQLFTYKSPLVDVKDLVISGNNGYIDSDPVPAAQLWVITTVVAFNGTTAPTAIQFINFGVGEQPEFYHHTKAFAIWERAVWSGHTYLSTTAYIRVYFEGGLAGDNCYLRLTGYKMTLET